VVPGVAGSNPVDHPNFSRPRVANFPSQHFVLGGVEDHSEFDSFVHARTPSLLRSAYLLTGDQHLAEDLVQSALARTHRAWKSLHEAGNAEAYTRKTMYHLQVSWWRRQKPLAGRRSIGIRQLPPYAYDQSATFGTEFQVVL
jgi:DNA-directed RNA polymerase specialized sigma24 family protein